MPEIDSVNFSCYSDNTLDKIKADFERAKRNADHAFQAWKNAHWRVLQNWQQLLNAARTPEEIEAARKEFAAWLTK